MSLCPVLLLSCVDNYVVFYVLCQCFMFLMSLCPVSLLSCVDIYVAFVLHVSAFHTFDVFVSSVIVALC